MGTLGGPALTVPSLLPWETPEGGRRPPSSPSRGAAGQRGLRGVCEGPGAPPAAAQQPGAHRQHAGALTRAGPARWGGDTARHPGDTHTCALRPCRCPWAASPVRAPGRGWRLSSPRLGQLERGSGPSRSGCSPRSLHLCFVPDPWCVPRRDRNSLLPALHNSLPTPLLPGHCIWSPGWLPPSAPAAPWIRELLFFQRKSCFPSQRWGWRAGQGGSLSTEHLLSGREAGGPLCRGSGG